jgi:hypothetical protein
VEQFDPYVTAADESAPPMHPLVWSVFAMLGLLLVAPVPALVIGVLYALVVRDF